MYKIFLMFFNVELATAYSLTQIGNIKINIKVLKSARDTNVL